MNWKKPLAVALTAAMLAGCSSGGTTGSNGGGTATGSGDSSKVVVAIDADLNSMDYQVATDGSSFIMHSMCVGGLTQLDADAQAQPDLAESWDVSEDGLTYTFHLRDGITWSNGTPVTADDFVFAWRRLDDPELASEYAFILTTIAVENAAEVGAGDLPLEDLGVEAADDQTFVVHLSQPCGFLLGLMAFPSFFPLNEEFFNAEGDAYATSIDDLLYCGPYTMTGYEAQNEYTFTKNDEYWDADNITVQTVVFKYLQDTQSAMLAFQQGDIDVVKLASEQVDAYADADGFQTRLQGYAWRLDFNYDDSSAEMSQDIKDMIANGVYADFREAISKALDRTSICEDVLKDGSVPAEGFIPKEFAYGPDGSDYRATAGNLITEDVTEAQAAFKKVTDALGKTDITVNLLCEDSEAIKSVAENLKSQLENNLPGLTVNIDSVIKKTRLEMMNNHQHDIGLTRWGPDYADPQTYLDLYKSDTAGYNGSYIDETYNAMLNKAETGEDAADADLRWADMVAAEAYLMENYVIVPVYQNGGAMMINPAVTGIEFHNAGVDSYRHLTKAA